MASDPIFADGFDNYRETVQRWTLGAASQGPGATYQADPAWSRHAWGQGAFIQDRLKAEIALNATVWVEGALKLLTRFQFPGHPTIQVGGLGVTDYPHCQVNLSASRHPYFVYSKDGSVIAGPTAGPDTVIQFDRWYWWMLKVVLHASAGSMELAPQPSEQHCPQLFRGEDAPRRRLRASLRRLGPALAAVRRDVQRR